MLREQKPHLRFLERNRIIQPLICSVNLIRNIDISASIQEEHGVELISALEVGDFCDIFMIVNIQNEIVEDHKRANRLLV
jgi:hypothetical protein